MQEEARHCGSEGMGEKISVNLIFTRSIIKSGYPKDTELN